MSIPERILEAYRELPAGQRGCYDVQRKLEEQGIEVWPNRIQALIRALPPIEINPNDIATTTTVLLMLGDVALAGSSDLEDEMKHARWMTSPLLASYPEDQLSGLIRAIARLLAAAAEAEWFQSYCNYLDRKADLRERERADRSEAAGPSESDEPIERGPK
jgi:hypothetical protein